MNCTIRKATKTDIDKIQALFIQMLQTIYKNKDVHGYENGYLNHFFDGDDIIYVAEADGDIVGFLSIEVYAKEETPFLYLDDFSVVESYRGNGIGTKLLYFAEQYARKYHIEHIVLHAETFNLRAQRLYQRLGYEKNESTDDRIRMIKQISV